MGIRRGGRPVRRGVCAGGLTAKGLCEKGLLYSPTFTKFRYCEMTILRVKGNEPFEVAIRRFKRTIEKSGLLTELRAREFYERPTAERKRKKASAVKRHFKRLRSQMLPKKFH